MTNDFSVIILCPDCNVAGLRTTSGSVRRELHVPCVAMVGQDATDNNILELSAHAKVYRGGKTITSLIDEGVSKTELPWCFFVMAGGWLKENLVRKYLYFRRSDKDILFPVIDRKIWFDEGSINGIMVHRTAFTEVGLMGDDEPDINVAKLLWAMRAIEHKYTFKGIVGAQLY